MERMKQNCPVLWRFMDDNVRSKNADAAYSIEGAHSDLEDNGSYQAIDSLRL